MEHTPSATSLVDRSAAWLLDHDGEIYGDERERLAYYEGTSVASSIQLLLLPWVLAGFAWLGPTSAHPALIAVAAVFYLPFVVMVLYVHRRHVDVNRSMYRSRKTVIVSIAMMIPMLAFVLAITIGADLRSDAAGDDIADRISAGLVGGVVGGIAGGLGAWAFGRRWKRRRQAALDAAEDA
jgi:hypothetical protein